MIAQSVQCPYDLSTLDGSPDGLPLVVTPRGDRDPRQLAAWIRDQHDWIAAQLTRHGAILFRGFDVADPAAFERVARAVDDELKNEYLGTSPRNALTDYVFTASELPPFYPIPQHCEMSFIAQPPRRLFFTCLVAPAQGSGETPLADFRKVLRDVDPRIRAQLEARGLRIVRNYAGPDGGGRFDLWKLKRWDEMFLTTDRSVVESKCRAEGFEPIWLGGGGLRLISTQPITRRRPVTGQEVWHNHSTTFHLSTAPGEYKRIYQLRPTLRNWFFWQLGRLLVALQRWTKTADELAMHCTYGDGGEIADADMEQIRSAVWKNMIIFPWRCGDIVAIDNYAIAHGRLPFQGPREIAVAWA